MNTRLARKILLAAAPVALLASAVVAYAHGQDTFAIHACFDTKSGATRIVAPTKGADPNSACNSKETPIEWDTRLSFPTESGTTLDLTQLPGPARSIKFADDAYLTLDEADPAGPRYYFMDGASYVFGVQNGLIDLSTSTTDNRLLSFQWEGTDEAGQYAGIQYRVPDAALMFLVPAKKGEGPVLALDIRDGVIDTSNSVVRAKVFTYRSDETSLLLQELPPGSFAFWSQSDTGTTYVVLNVGGLLFTSPMSVSG